MAPMKLFSKTNNVTIAGSPPQRVFTPGQLIKTKRERGKLIVYGQDMALVVSCNLGQKQSMGLVCGRHIKPEPKEPTLKPLPGVCS
jgi:hypothetical protein